MTGKELLKYFIDNSGQQRLHGEVYLFQDSKFGIYSCSKRAGHSLSSKFHEDHIPIGFPAALISKTIEASRDGVYAAWLKKGEEVNTAKNDRIYYIDDYEDYRIPNIEKPSRIIDCIENKIQGSPFQAVRLDELDMRLCEIIDHSELNYWLKTLIEDKLISNPTNDFVNAYKKSENELKFLEPFHHDFVLTPKAWKELDQRHHGKNSKKVFIAMSFGIKERPEIENAIVEACREVGFEAKAVDKVEYNGKITDKIFAMIKESAFVIADFTDNNHGVYFEAGFADGLGRPVISTIKADQVKTLHFDTAQTRHTLWNTPQELKEQLIDRIKATIL